MAEIAASNGSQSWLTVDELKQYVAPTQEAKDAVESFLKTQGIDASNISYSALGNTVTVQVSFFTLSLSLKPFYLRLFSSSSSQLSSKSRPHSQPISKVTDTKVTTLLLVQRSTQSQLPSLLTLLISVGSLTSVKLEESLRSRRSRKKILPPLISRDVNLPADVALGESIVI